MMHSLIGPGTMLPELCAILSCWLKAVHPELHVFNPLFAMQSMGLQLCTTSTLNAGPGLRATQ